MGKVAVCIVRESRKFLGHPYMGHSFLVIYVFAFPITLYRKTSNRSPSVPASIEDAASIRVPASIRSFMGKMQLICLV